MLLLLRLAFERWRSHIEQVLALTSGFLTAVLLAMLAVPASAQQIPAGSPMPQEDPELEISPRSAFLRSLVLPGWGQAYAGAPGRGAVYFSLAGGSVWMAHVARRQLQDARREQEWLREIGQLAPDGETEFAIARARHFEDWAALSLFLFFLSGADAYVAAHLADFEDRIGVLPSPEGAVQFRATLPVGRRR
jgi:hypothetical protein